MYGTVKWYSPSKRFGFISGDDGIDYYFSNNDRVGDIYTAGGDTVEFAPRRGPKGMRASSVNVLVRTPQTTTRLPVDHVARVSRWITTDHAGFTELYMSRDWTFFGYFKTAVLRLILILLVSAIWFPLLFYVIYKLFLT
jgi:CspA family cold shock protein